MLDNALQEQVRDYYQSHRLSFAQLSAKSQQIFNAKVSVDQLKHWSTEDGGWKKAAIEDTTKLKIIADKIFLLIEEGEDLSARDLTSLATTYLAFATKSPPDTIDDSRPPLQQITDMVAAALKEKPSGKLDE